MAVVVSLNSVGKMLSLTSPSLDLGQRGLEMAFCSCSSNWNCLKTCKRLMMSRSRQAVRCRVSAAQTQPGLVKVGIFMHLILWFGWDCVFCLWF